jgi:hypothetical protein
MCVDLDSFPPIILYARMPYQERDLIVLGLLCAAKEP